MNLIFLFFTFIIIIIYFNNNLKKNTNNLSPPIKIKDKFKEIPDDIDAISNCKYDFIHIFKNNDYWKLKDGKIIMYDNISNIWNNNDIINMDSSFYNLKNNKLCFIKDKNVYETNNINLITNVTSINKYFKIYPKDFKYLIYLNSNIIFFDDYNYHISNGKNIFEYGKIERKWKNIPNNCDGCFVNNLDIIPNIPHGMPCFVKNGIYYSYNILNHTIIKGYLNKGISTNLNIEKFNNLNCSANRGPKNYLTSKYLTKFVQIKNNLQHYKIPESGYYRIIAIGAGCGGKGGKIFNDLFIEKGSELSLLVGQKGQMTPVSNLKNDSLLPNFGSCSGSGGTFIYLNNKLIMVAGGGGGWGSEIYDPPINCNSLPISHKQNDTLNLVNKNNYTFLISKIIIKYKDDLKINKIFCLLTKKQISYKLIKNNKYLIINFYKPINNLNLLLNYKSLDNTLYIYNFNNSLICKFKNFNKNYTILNNNLIFNSILPNYSNKNKSIIKNSNDGLGINKTNLNDINNNSLIKNNKLVLIGGFGGGGACVKNFRSNNNNCGGGGGYKGGKSSNYYNYKNIISYGIGGSNFISELNDNYLKYYVYDYNNENGEVILIKLNNIKEKNGLQSIDQKIKEFSDKNIKDNLGKNENTDNKLKSGIDTFKKHMHHDTKHDTLINRLIFNNSETIDIKKSQNIDTSENKNKSNYISFSEVKILTNFVKIPIKSNDFKRFLVNLSTNESTDLSIHLLIIKNNIPKFKILYDNRPIKDSLSEDLDIEYSSNSNINSLIKNYEKKCAFGIYRNKSNTLYNIKNKVFNLRKNKILSLDRNIPKNTKFIYIFSKKKDILYNLNCIQYIDKINKNIIELEKKKLIQKKLIFNKINNDINSIIY